MLNPNPDLKIYRCEMVFQQTEANDLPGNFSLLEVIWPHKPTEQEIIDIFILEGLYCKECEDDFVCARVIDEETFNKKIHERVKRIRLGVMALGVFIGILIIFAWVSYRLFFFLR